MAKGNSVTVRIDGDSSGLKKELSNIKNTATAGLADIKAGIDLTAAATRKLFDVASKGINYNATIEQLKTSFEVMTGSAEKAAEVVDRLRVMGAETPFEMVDLASTTQLLMQYGFTADEAIDRMRMLGDIAQGNANAMNSIALGYAQMSSAGKVNLVDIKQMITAGFNPLQEISERTGESMASLYDRISKGTMTVEEITESMRHATSEGGKFFQSMEKQSQTLNGQLSTLKDNADQLLGSLTEGLSEGLRTELLPLASNLVAELQTAFDTGGYQGLIDSATGMLPDLLNMMTGELQKAITGLSRWLPQGATQLMKALPTALRGASAVVPEITTALFEISSVIITDLIGMLPELAPILAEGLGNTFVSALKGVFNAISGVYKGIEQAIHQGQTKIMGMWVDNEEIAKYDFSVDVTVDEEGAANQLSEGIRKITENIGAALTDGLPDTEEVIGGLETEVREWAQEAYATIDGWYQSEIDALNASGVTGEEYDALYAGFTEKAENLRTAVEGSETELMAWLLAMAGKSTEYVQQHLGELDTILAAYEEAILEIDKLSNKARSAAQNAFQVVRSGAKADEATISMAIKLKVDEYKLDEQSAEDEYNKAVRELQAEFNAPDSAMTLEQYNARASDLEAKKNEAITAAKAILEKSLGEIFSGVAESEGILNAVTEATKNINFAEVLLEFANSFEDASGVVGDEFGDQLTNLLAEYMQVDPEAIKSMQKSTALGVIESWAMELFDEAQIVISETGSSKMQAAYSAALQEGLLAGTSFDTEIASEQLSAILVAMVSEGAVKAKPKVTEATKQAVEDMPVALDKKKEAADAGAQTTAGYADGILSGKSSVISAATSVANSAINTFKSTLGIASPSKVMMEIGQFTGEGYAIGLQESMANAVLVARRMTGEIITAANMSMPMQVKVPDMQQSIEYALEATQQPINLYVNGRELARVTASDTQQAQNWHNRRIALGVGK